jgi:hypothetical protein
MRSLWPSGSRPSKVGRAHWKQVSKRVRVANEVSSCRTWRRSSKSLAPSCFISDTLREKRRMVSRPNVGTWRYLSSFEWGTEARRSYGRTGCLKSLSYLRLPPLTTAEGVRRAISIRQSLLREVCRTRGHRKYRVQAQIGAGRRHSTIACVRCRVNLWHIIHTVAGVRDVGLSKSSTFALSTA